MKDKFQSLIRKVAGQKRPLPLIVLAPHPDDEVIGCHMLLRLWPGEKNIWFFSEEDRLCGDFTPLQGKNKAEHLSRLYCLNYEWMELGDELELAIEAALPTHPVFAVPNTLDHHPWHREVTRQFHRHINPLQDAIYYSVSKNTPTLMLLSDDEIEVKKAVLRNIYPNEKLWEKDESFVLFESYERLPGEQWIWVTSEFVGFHYWPDAPAKTDFLRNVHRHIFKVTVKVSVGHEDREVEFFDLQNKLNSHLTAEYDERNLASMSCEMIATHIARNMMNNFSESRRIEVTVSEDGENGATIRQ